MKKVTVLLEDDLHRRLRFMSIETGESLQRMIVRLLQIEVGRHKAGTTKGEEASAMRGCIVKRGGENGVG